MQVSLCILPTSLVYLLTPTVQYQEYMKKSTCCNTNCILRKLRHTLLVNQTHYQPCEVGVNECVGGVWGN